MSEWHNVILTGLDKGSHEARLILVALRIALVWDASEN